MFEKPISLRSITTYAAYSICDTRSIDSVQGWAGGGGLASPDAARRVASAWRPVARLQACHAAPMAWSLVQGPESSAALTIMPARNMRGAAPRTVERTWVRVHGTLRTAPCAPPRTARAGVGAPCCFGHPRPNSGCPLELTKRASGQSDRLSLPSGFVGTGKPVRRMASS